MAAIIQLRGGGFTMNGNIPEYLMIENNGSDVEIFYFDFREYGIANKFHIERNGADALDYLFAKDGSLREEPPRAILLDLYMPKISGLDFLRIIKSDEQTKDIPVVVLESSISPTDIEKCQSLGVNDFIEKPLEYENFISVINKILS
jgi:two-component system, response regulator